MPKVHDVPGTTSSAPPGDGGGGPPDEPVISSLDFSWLAEKADGIRDEDLDLVKDKKGVLQIREPAESGEAPVRVPGDQFIAKVRTKASCKREEVLEVTIETRSGKQPPIKGKGPDALFWTESAVEKFLYPYYHSQRTWDATMDALRAKFAKDSKAFAILHRAPSTSESLDVQKTLEIARLTGPNAAPKLEWVGVADYLKKP